MCFTLCFVSFRIIIFGVVFWFFWSAGCSLTLFTLFDPACRFELLACDFYNEFCIWILHLLPPPPCYNWPIIWLLLFLKVICVQEINSIIPSVKIIFTSCSPKERCIKLRSFLMSHLCFSVNLVINFHLIKFFSETAASQKVMQIFSGLPGNYSCGFPGLPCCRNIVNVV